MGDVIEFISFQERQAQEVIDHIMDLPENKFVEFLRRSRQEFLSRGEDEKAKSFVNVAINLRAKKLTTLCTE
jgi:hypothetical protein